MRSDAMLAGFGVLLVATSGLSASFVGAASPAALGAAALPAHPSRVVSVTLSTDEMLLAILDTDRILALSTFADDALASNVADDARAIRPRARGDAEALLALEPDLVVTNPFASADAMALLDRARVPVLRVPAATSIADVEEALTTLGVALGEGPRAAQVATTMRARLSEVRLRVRGAPRPRALLYTTGGWVAGADTLGGELLDVAGADNAAREIGIVGHAVLSAERLLELDPDVVLVVEYRADGRAREVFAPTPFAEDPLFAGLSAVKNGRVLALEPRRVLSASHHVADGALELARLLHPERFPR